MNKTGGIGFFGLLTIVFIILKLCKVIDWSWWWVLSPILFSICVFVISVIVITTYLIKGGK